LEGEDFYVKWFVLKEFAMALREYKCSECGMTDEVILPSSQAPDPTKPCPRCGAESKYVQFSTFGLALSSFSEAPIDTVIGKQADDRWKMYNDRKEARDKVRKDSGSVGLTAVGYEEYVPVSDETKARRTRMYDVAERTGIPADPEALQI
jgi:putative FmdB family regulatory protein